MDVSEADMNEVHGSEDAAFLLLSEGASTLDIPDVDIAVNIPKDVEFLLLLSDEKKGDVFSFATDSSPMIGRTLATTNPEVMGLLLLSDDGNAEKGGVFSFVIGLSFKAPLLNGPKDVGLELLSEDGNENKSGVLSFDTGSSLNIGFMPP